MLVHWILFAVLVPLEISTLSKTEHVKLALRNVVGSEKHLSHGQSVEDVQHRRVSAWTGLRIFAHRSFTENTKNELDSEVHHGYVLKDKGVLSKMLPEDMSGPTIDKSSYETTEMTHSKTEKRSSTKRTISTLAQLLTRTPVKEEYKQLKLKIKTLKNRDLARKCTEVPLSNCGNCDNDGTCRQHNWYDNVYFCECQEPYYGDHCEFVDYSWCENECQNGGTCETMVNNDAGEVYHQCVCDSLRYYGDFCQYGMDCTSPGCECLNGGYCHVDYDAEGVLYSFCICNWLFYGGDHCQDLVGDMVTEQMANDVYSACADDCEHGWCDESDTCQCDNGYSGINCEIGNGNDVFTTPDVDVIGATTEQANIIANIVSSSCAEDCVHGSCDESGICKCDDGYSGMYCLIDDYTVCLATCQHGLCDINGVCICHVGFNGNNCEHITDEMSVVTDESALAGNGAITIQVVDFDDATTEQAIILEHYVSSAVSSLCAGLCEHGWCDEFHNCKCDAGYSGNYCEIENSCAATCVSGLCDESGLCVCFEGYYGVHCDDKDQFCHTGRPCSNGGTCHSVFVGDGKIFDSYCQCAGAYLGHHCDEDCFATCEHGLCDVYGACVCDEGYHGDKCEHIAEVSVQSEESDATAECGQLCQNGTCNEYGECICEYGYHGSYCENKDVSINTVDESAECGQLCQNGTCNEYGECICEYGYHGSYCENEDVSINAVDESECGQLCQNGTCNEYGECTCEYGYHGSYCENKDVSMNTVDESECGQLCQNGTCNEYGECICQYGYHGKYCENEDVSINTVDESDSECMAQQVNDMLCGGCNTGTCLNYICCNSEPSCYCMWPYDGLHCEIDMDDVPSSCKLENCNDHGDCIVNKYHQYRIGPEYLCDCKYPFTGSRCQIKADDCHGNCSEHGVCKSYKDENKNSIAVCECDFGYEGSYCQVGKDLRATQHDDCPCQNGGMCYKDPIYEVEYCICASPFEGPLCERDISCDSCQNGGSCVEHDIVNPTGSETQITKLCECVYPYMGTHCEIDGDCTKYNICKNGGTCVTCNANEYHYCECPLPYFGEFCQESLNDYMLNGSDLQNTMED
uniref:Neurogenic locus notch homolog protein 2-like isoform X3 n=1 Tax=Saccoglossus kowalevskii TaxID=10224 RepID=A0ABM0MWY1_SACKO|nr:PREDICTED: neurogenic locus notch homolog protein 2-like isoform X3 [Saccoglossus kowalevskii]